MIPTKPEPATPCSAHRSPLPQLTVALIAANVMGLVLAGAGLTFLALLTASGIFVLAVWVRRLVQAERTMNAELTDAFEQSCADAEDWYWSSTGGEDPAEAGEPDGASRGRAGVA